nr:hypothetical protein Iba_chr04dCG12170 [Ipomoea batatas]
MHATSSFTPTLCSPTTSGPHSNVYMLKDLITMRSKDESRLHHSISVSKQQMLIVFKSLGLLCMEEDKDDRPVRLKLPNHPKLLRVDDSGAIKSQIVLGKLSRHTIHICLSVAM